MITLKALLQKALGHYEAVLAAYLRADTWEPLVIRANKSLDRRAGLDAIYAQQADLLLQSKNRTGRGYSLTIKPNTRTGQSEISQISFDTLADYLTFTQKEAEFEAFTQDVAHIQATLPALLPLLEKRPRLVVDQAGKWSDLLNVAAYFVQHPQPRQYVRALPLGLPTKFIEQNRAALRVLLDDLIPDYLNADETDFYRRYHLLQEEPLIRIRFLDQAVRLHSALSHITVWLGEFRNLPLPGKRVFIIENLTSFLTFPNLPDSVAIWGGGFAVANLNGIAWLAAKEIVYWGDLDAHGFQILNQCRGYFPHTQSLLMDQPTFDHHAHLVSRGEHTSVIDLPNLNDEEQALFTLLKANNWRIEQERLDEAWVATYLSTFV